MDSEVLIKVEGVGKKFCRSLKKSLWYGLKDMVGEATGALDALDALGSHAQLRDGEFWAVNNISFELKRGECLGLIGHNGAGKTTLLKMLNGLIKPDRGRITMRGRVGALIALGAGFNPILTGRENIYVNGSVLGLSKQEIESKIQEIIDFAEIGEFIDSPVQSYSSGMNVRLGFAVAVILIEPDILFLDEVLAVGDIGFTIKCLNAVRRLTQKAAVIFVSHTMQFVSAFCTRVIVMDHGRTLMDACDPADGIDRYYSMISLEKQQSGAGGAEILQIVLKANGAVFLELEPKVEQGMLAEVSLQLRITTQNRRAHLTVNIHNEAATPVMCIPVQDQDGDLLCLEAGVWRVDVPLGKLDLNAGKYSFVIAIRDAESSVMLCRSQGVLPFRVFAPKAYWGSVVRPSTAHVLAE